MPSPPRLSSPEPAPLHEAVAAAVNLALTPAAPPAPEKRRIPWGPLAIAAAALAGLVVAVPLSGLLSVGGDNGASPETIALAATTTPSSTREDSIAADPAPAEAPAPFADDLPENSEIGSQDGAGAPETTSAPATTITTTAAAETTIATSFRQRPDGEAILAYFLVAPDDIEGLDEGGDVCNAEALDLLGDDGARAAMVPDGGTTAVVWFTSAGDGSIDRVLVYDAADCRLLATGP